jgi:hypothetical protein
MDPVASRGEQDEVHEQRRHLRQRRPHQRAYSVHDGMNHQFFSEILYNASNSGSSTDEIHRNLRPSLNSLGKATAKVIEAKTEAGEKLLEEGFWLAYDAWFKWGTKSKLRNWINTVVHSDEGFRDYLFAIGGYRTSHDGSGEEKEYFWLNHHRLETFASLQDGIQRCQRLGAAAADAREKMLFQDAEAAFRAQALYSKGRRKMVRKFPDLLNLRLVSASGEVGTPTAIFLDQVPAPSPGELPSLESKIEAYFQHRGPHMVRANLTLDGGQSTISTVTLNTQPKTAEEIGKALGLPYVLMIFDDGRVIAIGLGGEGHLQLGLVEDLLIRTSRG